VIAAEPLSQEAFSALGRVVDEPAGPPDASGDAWRWWAETALLGPVDGRYALGYLELEDEGRGFDWAERHLRSEELVVPVRGELLLYAGEPSSNGPAGFRAFRMRPGQAALLDKGVWHGAPLAVGGPAAALVLLLEGTGATDTEVVRFDEVTVEVRD
jgi:ureidoglycolate lyase